MIRSRKFGNLHVMMEIDWRWFGRKDGITLKMLRQIGVEGVVTALHDIPNGEVWPEEAVRALRDHISAHGLRWSVVESLPVSEAIKYAGPERDALIENYRKSLANLGRCGIRTVCYNFMPVIDWVRTDLERPLPDGSTTLYFDYARFAYFDIAVLGREGAENDYPPEILEKVDSLKRTMTPGDDAALVDTIIVKTQGFINGNVAGGGVSPVSHFKSLLAKYSDTGRERLRENLKYFLEAVMPVCREYGIGMCIHPDDPPMPVFGLPRIAGSAEDLRRILGDVDDAHNGLTFCAGSLSAGPDNDVEAMAEEFAQRTLFVHLRSCNLLPGGDFVEASHISGRVDLARLVEIFDSAERDIPMRVDHGRNILGDAKGGYNPGYGFYGRMLALGQVQGMIAAVRSMRGGK